MMKLLRNREIRRTLFLMGVLGLAAGAIALPWDIRAAVLILILSVLFMVVYLLSTHWRYRRLADFACDIDRILHGDANLSLASYSEGELGILQSEIQKMVIHLREQQQSLLDDKLFLSSSIADISHQIRTPLTSINLLISLLNDSSLAPERREKLVFELRELLTRMDWLVTTLLKISQLDAGVVQFKTETIALDELIRTAISPLLVPMDIRAQEFALSASGNFTGDAAWTREAIVNIAKNCMEHTPPGGKITIAAQENALFSEIVIVDTGSGISPKDIAHIFDRFYKGTNSSEKSFGIGLSLARMIITAQNGTIKAENRLTGGAQFTIRFYKSVI